MKTKITMLAIFSTIYTNQVLAEAAVQEVKIVAQDNTVKSIYILEDATTGDPITYEDACKKYPEYCAEKKETTKEIKTEPKKNSRTLVTSGMSVDFKGRGRTEKLEDERPAPLNGLSFIHHEYDLDKKEYVGVEGRLNNDQQFIKYENQIKNKGVEIEVGTRRISMEGALTGANIETERIMHAIYAGAGYSMVETKNHDNNLKGISCYQLPVKSKHIAQITDNFLFKVEAGVVFLKCNEEFNDETKKGNPWVVGVQANLKAVYNVTDRLWLQGSIEQDPTVYDNSVRTKAVNRDATSFRLGVGFDLEKRRIQARSR